ncbi:MAG TPA: PLP-dependent transferase [Candidatus Acidoferrales bacterium]|nr:PLP-dependent transferase [Candidatus Acidoferrales bacterium]
MRDETLAVRARRAGDGPLGDVVAPIHLSTAFERDPDGSFSRGYSYRRDGNPTCDALEASLKDLEGGADAIVFSSGMAAACAVVSSLAPGDVIVAARDLYFGFRELLTEHFARWGVASIFVDVNQPGELSRALEARPKLVWIETPSNPLIEVVDVSACASLAHAAGALLVCENSFASPALQKPLQLGADVVVHSVTKYLAGHGDAMAGAIVVKSAGEPSSRMRAFSRVAGAVLGPFDAWLALRGIETLYCRMRAHCANARAIAEFLNGHPRVARVHYPGLPEDPGHAIAKRQMRDFGGMLAFEVKGGRTQAFEAIARLRVISRATSLGGTHSSVEHRASVEGAHSRAPDALLRLSAGIEHVDDLLEDLTHALAGC